MARTPRKELLKHLFGQIKARAESADLNTDAEKADFIAAGRMKVQARVADDPSRRKAVRCPRRAGKSWITLSIAIEKCLRKRDSVWVIVGLARPTVQLIFWNLLKKLNQQLELGLTFREVELSATFFNGSTILFRGAETRSEAAKIRGGQYDGVIIDECKDFNPLLFKELIEDIVEPALADRKGTLILIGTPGDVLSGPFYEATCEDPIVFTGADGVKRATNHLYGTPVTTPYIWSLHTWTLEENIELPHLWTEALATKALRGWGDDHPSWRREYLGHWVAGTNRIVYRFNPREHEYDGALPEGTKWIFVLGVDIGFKDGDAIVVWAYSRESYHVYQVYGEKRKKLNVTELAAWVREVRGTYCGADGPEVMTADWGGNGTKILQELAAIHELYLQPAEKKEKNDFIELFNNELDAKRIHILRNNPLGDELLTNKWLEKTVGTEKKKEDPKTPNDLCDAGLYGWRWCDHRRPVPPDRKLKENTMEWWLQRQKEELAAATREHLKRKASGEDYSQMDAWKWN